jgi:thiosulfate/3-mercaptopyruvate sulfurtransferase
MVWVYDGSLTQYPDDFTSSTHGSGDCTACHGGDDMVDTRAAAHVTDWESIPDSSNCSCHGAIATASEDSLHTNLGGYVTILNARGADVSVAGTLKTRFDEQCTRCHVANDDTELSACGFCHVSVPVIAGGGFLNGHNFRKTPDMERNCTACHGSRIKDEFFGLNQDLVDRNTADAGYTSSQLASTGLLAPDVHFNATQAVNADGYELGCTLCHSANEMHGGGAPIPAGNGDRYAVTSAPDCTDAGCHETPPSNTFHDMANHLTAMACQVCHAQPYKNCFGCHTDVDTGDTGLPYYTINEGDPAGTNDALMTFRIGANLNPSRAFTYAVLRHVPVDMDTFRYSDSDPVDGLIPNMTNAPTWKYASPHNIVRNTAITEGDFSACSNCHNSPGYEDFWLTDPLLDDEGWLPAAYESDEAAANTLVKVTEPIDN